MQDLSGLMIFFSSLDRRKEAKEDQGVRDASQVWPGTCWNLSVWVRIGLCVYLKIKGLQSDGLETFRGCLRT